MVSALAPLSCGCRRIIQVDAAHWWWLRRDPPPHMIVQRFGCIAIHHKKALYKNHSFIHISNPALKDICHQKNSAWVIFGPFVLEADISYVRSMQVCRKAMERFANGRKSPANTSIKAEQTSIHDTELLPNTLSFHFPPSLISMLKNSLRYKVGIVKLQEPH